MNARRAAWALMAAAFCASLALALGILAAFGAQSEGVRIALGATARLNILIFWPAYVGGALVSLFGRAFAPVRQRARDLGLAFAAALVVHLGLVVRLCAIGHRPGGGTFVIFGAAAICVYLLALLSVPRVRKALPDRFWPPIRALAMNYVALAFLYDFTRPGLAVFHEGYYLPFAALAVSGPILRFAARAYALRAPMTARLNIRRSGS